MLKGILLVIGAYVVTLAATAVTLPLAVGLLAPRGCSEVSNAVRMQFVLLAVLFIISAAFVILRARKITTRTGGRLAIAGVYVTALAVSYIVIAFGLLVLFNC